jgi:hypothetical protein
LTSLVSLVVGRDGWDAAEVSVFDAVAVSFECDDLGVMHESVDHGRGNDVVAEHFAPSPEGFIRRDDEAGPFVAGRHQLEEQVGGFGLERDVTHFVDYEQWVAGEADEFGLQRATVMGGGQAVNPLRGGGEQDAVPSLAGADRDPDRQVRFPGSRSEGDRLQQLRAVLPCEVRVVAETHPLFGRLLAAKSFKRWNGVLLLVIDLPDGSPGTIRCDATDVLGVVEPGPRAVLDGAGLRALHRLVEQLATRAEVGVSGMGAQVGSPRP